MKNLRVYFYTRFRVFLLLARNLRVNCVQYGGFTSIIRACNAAILSVGIVCSIELITKANVLYPITTSIMKNEFRKIYIKWDMLPP